MTYSVDFIEQSSNAFQMEQDLPVISRFLVTTYFSTSHMIVPTINFIPYQQFDLDPFLKFIPGISPGIDMVNIQMLDFTL